MYFLSQTYRQFYPNTYTYQYDANGNMVLDSIGRVMKDGHLEENISKRQLLWDEENRLLAINDNGYVSSYLYNANGDRTVKLSGNNEAVYVNTIPSANETQTDRFTIYPSPYMVFANGGRYTKHIYIGSERIASKVAIDNGYDPRTTQTAAYGNNKYVASLNNKSTALKDSIEAIYTKFQLPFNGLNNDDIIQGFQPSLMSLASTALSTDNYEEYSYYIHSDHLGSTSYVTDANGEVSQHVEYVPFGEVFIDELSSSAKLNTPFLFNGKELDEETGLYYYGARYYDPRTSLWLSTDPMELKYPNISTYTYCACNPVKFINPDGKYILFINGLRLWYGARDQKTFWTNSLGGKTSIYKTDEMNYWSGVNHNKKYVNIPNYYIEQYNDQNIGFTSGSSFWNSDVAHRINDGKIKAQQFHELVQNGEIIIGQNEPIRIIAHSQGAAHAVGFAEQLQTYKDSNGKNLYNIEVIEYIAPHQPTDITHPNGIKGIQYSHPDDQIASKNWWINGGTEFGKIKNIPVFIYQNGRHSVLDNDIFIKNGEKYR